MNNTSIEVEAIEVFNENFGTVKLSRYHKVKEEFEEMTEAFEEYIRVPHFGKSNECEEHLKDEISDLYATVTHLASLFGLHHQNLLEMAIDKVEKRKTNPKYKRFV